MPASIDTILPVPALAFDQHSSSNNTPAMFNYGDQDVVLPNINSYMSDFTFDMDDTIGDVDAASIALMTLEYLKNLMMGFHLHTAA
jgi:hypothetical protein